MKKIYKVRSLRIALYFLGCLGFAIMFIKFWAGNEHPMWALIVACTWALGVLYLVDVIFRRYVLHAENFSVQYFLIPYRKLIPVSEITEVLEFSNTVNISEVVVKGIGGTKIKFPLYGRQMFDLKNELEKILPQGKYVRITGI